MGSTAAQENWQICTALESQARVTNELLSSGVTQEFRRKIENGNELGETEDCFAIVWKSPTVEMTTMREPPRAAFPH